MLNKCPVSSYDQVCDVFKKELGKTPDQVCTFDIVFLAFLTTSFVECNSYIMSFIRSFLARWFYLTFIFGVSEFALQVLMIIFGYNWFPLWRHIVLFACHWISLFDVQVFDDFDPVPIASASLAQVHVARNHDGQKVAVKVLVISLLPEISFCTWQV